MNRLDERIHRRAHILSLLMRTSDEQLHAYGNRASLDHALDERRAQLARDMLDAVAEAIERNDEELWQRIDRAHDALYGERSAEDPRSGSHGDVPVEPRPSMVDS